LEGREPGKEKVDRLPFSRLSPPRYLLLPQLLHARQSVSHLFGQSVSHSSCQSVSHSFSQAVIRVSMCGDKSVHTNDPLATCISGILTEFQAPCKGPVGN